QRNDDVTREHHTWASAVVRVRDPRFEPLMRSLLANCVVVDDLDTALAIRAANPRLTAATLSGEFVDEHGILSAVSRSHIGEIGTLTQEVAQLEAQLSGQEAIQTNSEQRKTATETELSVLRADLH